MEKKIKKELSLFFRAGRLGVMGSTKNLKFFGFLFFGLFSLGWFLIGRCWHLQRILIFFTRIGTCNEILSAWPIGKLKGSRSLKFFLGFFLALSFAFPQAAAHEQQTHASKIINTRIEAKKALNIHQRNNNTVCASIYNTNTHLVTCLLLFRSHIEASW